MLNYLLFNKLDPVQFTYQVTVTAAQATTPKFTFASGAPTAQINWGDGSAYEAVTSAVELTHTYTVAGTYIVQLLMPNQEKWLTQIDINSDKLSKVITPIQAFRNLTLFYAYSNTAWAQNISGWVLPASLVHFYISSTSISGDISGWVLPASLVYFYVSSTSVSGDISGWVLPASLVYFYVYATSVSGSPIFTSTVALSNFQYQNCALPQATVDLIVSRIYDRRISFTAAAPSANVGGTNAAPSGIYEHEGPPPVGGKNMIYTLVNDENAEGFKKWTWTYTA